MKKVLKAVAAATLVFWSTAGMAALLDAGNSYVGVQYTAVTYSPDGSLDDFEPTAIVGRIGMFVSDYFSVEARFGTGISDDSQTVNAFLGPAEVALEIDHF